MLCSHADTMGLLQLAVEKLAASRQENADLTKTASLGTGIDDPGTTGKKGYDSLTDGRLGHKTSELKESDRALIRRLRGS